MKRDEMHKKLFSLLLLVNGLASCVLCAPLFARPAADNSLDKASAVSVVDGIGRTVTVSAPPKRIVSLSPAATEILFAVGAQTQLAARTDLCNYPPEAASVPSLGGFDGKTFSLERIIAFRPDFVYATDVMHNHLIAPLERYGIPVYVSNADSIEEVLAEITEIGSLTGNAEQAQSCVRSIEAKIAQASVLVNAHKRISPVHVYWEVWNSPYMSAGNSSFIHALIEKAGAQNVFSDVAQPYPVVSEESIIARKPDIIIYAADSPVTAESICARAGWNLIPAVQNAHVFGVDSDLLSRPGPRIGDAVLTLAEMITKATETSDGE